MDIEGYWGILRDIEIYCDIMRYIEIYWEILKDIERYWYWYLDAKTSTHIFIPFTPSKWCNKLKIGEQTFNLSWNLKVGSL